LAGSINIIILIAMLQPENSTFRKVPTVSGTVAFSDGILLQAIKALR
jgi:hypothetical protein